MNKKKRSNRPISLGDKLRTKNIALPKPKVITFNTIMKFGKYKGRQAGNIRDYDYFKWLSENTDWQVDPDLTRF